MKGQLPLPIRLRDGNTLETFLPGAAPEAHAAVRRMLDGLERRVWIWGPPSSGRTHLLEATISAFSERRLPVAFVPLGPGLCHGPGVLDGLGDASLVCLDDVDLVAGKPDWEEALFILYNDLHDRGGCLMVSASAPPASTPFRLKDLASRMSLCLCAAIAPADDPVRKAILLHRAAARGLELPADTVDYLMTRASRRLADLVSLLDRLDREALVHRRRLTVPFIRQVIADEDA